MRHDHIVHGEPNKETLNNSAETQSDKCDTYRIHVKISFSMMNTKILNT